MSNSNCLVILKLVGHEVHPRLMMFEIKSMHDYWLMNHLLF